MRFLRSLITAIRRLFNGPEGGSKGDTTPRPKPSKKKFPPPEIASLIAWREQVRGRNVDASGGPGHQYLFRPGELLAAEGEQEIVQSLVPGPDLPEPTRIETAGGTILHFRSPQIQVRRVVERARTIRPPDEPAPRIGPNLIFSGEQAYQGCPGDWPKPGPDDDFSGDGEGPIVAILDTGYTAGVHDSDGLDSRFGTWGPPTTAEILDAGPPDGWRDFEAGHATFICGIIARHARRARLRVIPTLDSDGRVDEAELVNRILALDDDVDIVNLSLGGFGVDNTLPVALSAAIAGLPPGTAVVAAAGNAGPSEPRLFWPAQLHKERPCGEKVVFAVGALEDDDDETLAVYSTEPADLYAKGRHDSAFIHFDESPEQPGGHPGRVPQTFNGYANWAGTSFATAVMAATIANGMEDGRTALEVARDLCGNDQTAA